jgi:GH24 family phage-related lysozyme (muramidase)
VWDKTLFANGCTKAEAEQRLRAELERTLAVLRAAHPGLDQRQEETLLDFAHSEGIGNLKPEFVSAVLARDWDRIVKQHLYVRYAGHAPDHPRNKAFLGRITNVAVAAGP